MQSTTELRNLLHFMNEKEQSENKLRELISQLENQGKKIRNTYLPFPQRQANHFKLTKSIGFRVLKLLTRYFLIYLVIAIVLGIIELILIIPGWLFGFSSASVLNRIMYVLTLPAVWLTRLILWLTSFWPGSIGILEYFEEVISWIGIYYNLGWDSIILVLGASLITSIIVIVFSFIVDVLLIPIRSTTTNQYNNNILEKNEEIEASKIKAFEDWTSSTKYNEIINSISRVKSRIEKSEQDINASVIIHSSLKDEDTVIRLINILETGRATDITNAINKMDEDKHNERLEYMQMESIYRAEEEAKYREQEARSAQKRTEAILHQIADNSARTEATANAIFWMSVLNSLED